MTQRLKILVVDDEQVILDSARKILDPGLWHVLTAPDAESALHVLAAEAPHILISDLVLPGASGMKLLATASEQDPTLLAIITTGYSAVENAVAALKRGAFDFLPKPFTCDELLSCAARARRAIELRLALGAGATAAGHHGTFRLGTQSWARVERDGTALLGMTDFHLQTVDRITCIELPEVNAEIRQGGRLLSLLTADGLAHTVWSPLGGRVLACNDRLRDQPESLRDDPSGTGWIARILPADLDGERANLIGS